MLNYYAITADALSLAFNASISARIAIGKLARLPFKPILLGSSHSEWFKLIKYLGVNCMSAKF